MLQVPPDLVHASRQRNCFDERVAAGGREALDARHCVNLRTVLPARDWMVDDPVFRMTARQREIALLDSSFFEGLSESTRSLHVEGHHDRPARPAIEAMHGVDPHAHSVSDRSHEIFGVVREPAVHDDPRRFVDDDKSCISKRQIELHVALVAMM